jgi:hypothetical protein
VTQPLFVFAAGPPDQVVVEPPQEAGQPGPVEAPVILVSSRSASPAESRCLAC